MRTTTPPVLGLVAALLLGGCALATDGAYLIWRGGGSQQKDTRSEPTAEVEQRRLIQPDPAALALRCVQRERPIQRQITTVRRYRYQNGWTRPVMAFPLAIDGLLLLTVGLGVRASCTGDAEHPPKISCDGLYALVPIGVDALYAALRTATLKPPILVGREVRSQLLPSADEERSAPLPCPPGVTLVLSQGLEQLRAEVDPSGAPPADFTPRAQAFVATHGAVELRVDLGSLSGWEAGPPQPYPPPPAGNRTVTTVPRPGALSSSMVPP